MQIFSTFEYSSYLELAISLLENKGILKENIYTVALDSRENGRRLFDSLHHSDGISLIDLSMVLATAFAVIGASLGFILVWGPIYLGLIGALGGFMVGSIIKIIVLKIKQKNQRQVHAKNPEVILIVECSENQAEFVANILWEHFALGMAKVKS